MKGPVIGYPLAAFRAGDRAFWILQEHGYEDESYAIVEIGVREVTYRLDVNGGGC
jgi:hypothetical protein